MYRTNAAQRPKLYSIAFAVAEPSGTRVRCRVSHCRSVSAMGFALLPQLSAALGIEPLLSSHALDLLPFHQ